MKNWEALKAVQDGYCVRHNTWIAGTHLKPGFKRSPDDWVRGAEWHLAHYEDGWEVYEPEESGHDWAWACEQMLDGKKVRRKLWIAGHWYQRDCADRVANIDLALADFKATDWVLADEGVKP